MLTRPIPIIGGSGSLPSMTGNALRRLRVNEAGSASEWANDSTEVINVEEARSDIRSTTRAGYSTFDSQPGLQALLDTVGTNKTLLFPPNGVFNLNNKSLTTKSNYQCLASDGESQIVNGNIVFGFPWSRLKNLVLSGTSSYGIDVQSYKCSVSGLTIMNKTTGINITTYNGWYFSLTDSLIHQCGKGAYFNLNDSAPDYGDAWFSNVKITGCTDVGIHLVKHGGFNLIGSKVQNCAGGGLLFETAVGNIGQLWGHYIANSSFEDNTTFDLKVNSLGGSYIPKRIEIIGGTIHKIVLNSGDQISLSNVLIPISAVHNSGCTNVFVSGCPEYMGLVTGTGTSYMIVDINSTHGPVIKIGTTGVKLIDSTNTTGSKIGPYVTSIASAPAYIGQKALVGTTWYYAVGTSSPSDWVSGGGGGVDGGLFTDTYTISGVDGGAF